MRIDRVIILDAAGAGQSARILQLKMQYGADLIVDHWDGIEDLPPRCLALAANVAIVPPVHSCVMTYDAALADQRDVKIG